MFLMASTFFDRLPVRRILAEAANKGNLAQGRELGLDVVRGLAILLAMGYHLNQVDAGPVANVLLRPGAKIGWAGVDLFFVLSGFLIGGMVLKEANLSGGFNYKRFLMRRILRLWPTLYTFLVAMVLFGFPPRDFFWQISLHIQGYVPTKSATHLWSLAVEEQFYLLLALGFSILSRTCGWRRTLPWILGSLIILCPILRAIAPSLGYSHWDIYVLTHFRIDTLAAGVLLAFAASQRPELFERLLRGRVIWAAVVMCGVVFLWGVPKGSPLGEIAGYSVSWVSSAATILVLYRAPVPAFLCWPCRLVAFLGQISYPMYLWHVAVFKLARIYLPRLIGEGREGLQTALIYLAVIAVAFAVTVLIERPVMRLRDKILPAPRKITV
jgi:peptidoglycan/LPS O-acetylase OafA/YrhL